MNTVGESWTEAVNESEWLVSSADDVRSVASLSSWQIFNVSALENDSKETKWVIVQTSIVVSPYYSVKINLPMAA